MHIFILRDWLHKLLDTNTNPHILRVFFRRWKIQTYCCPGFIILSKIRIFNSKARAKNLNAHTYIGIRCRMPNKGVTILNNLPKVSVTIFLYAKMLVENLHWTVSHGSIWKQVQKETSVRWLQWRPMSMKWPIRLSVVRAVMSNLSWIPNLAG